MDALFVCWILIHTLRVFGNIYLCCSSILDVLLVPMCEWSCISISCLQNFNKRWHIDVLHDFGEIKCLRMVKDCVMKTLFLLFCYMLLILNLTHMSIYSYVHSRNTCLFPLSKHIFYAHILYVPISLLAEDCCIIYWNLISYLHLFQRDSIN